MVHRKRLSVSFLIVPMLLALLLALVFSCSDQPTAVKKTSASGLSGGANIDPSASGSFLLGTVSDSTVVAPGRIEVWATNVAFTDSTGIVSFDVQLLNRTRGNIFPSIHFVITDIIPNDIAVVGFDGVSGDGFPFYDFSAKLGADNVLEPGERTESVRMQFHTVTLRSFAIGFRIDVGPAGGGAAIAGVVYRDDNQNGGRDRCDRCEPGIPGITVVLQRNSEGAKETLITSTGENGEYRFAGLKEGVYSVSVIVPLEKWKVTTTNPLLVTLVKGSDGTVQDFLGADFGLFPLLPPPPEKLFGPVIIGPGSRFGTELDSTFVNPPSPLTVVFKYYLEVGDPPFMSPIRRGAVDSASAWINGAQVFDYHRPIPVADSTDTSYFKPQTIQLPDSLVTIGENTIRLLTNGTEHAALMWRVYRKP